MTNRSSSTLAAAPSPGVTRRRYPTARLGAGRLRTQDSVVAPRRRDFPPTGPRPDAELTRGTCREFVSARVAPPLGAVTVRPDLRIGAAASTREWRCDRARREISRRVEHSRGRDFGGGGDCHTRRFPLDPLYGPSFRRWHNRIPVRMDAGAKLGRNGVQRLVAVPHRPIARSPARLRFCLGVRPLRLGRGGW